MIICCNKSHIEPLTEFYDNVTLYLEQTINYPKWRHKAYPSRDSVVTAIANNTQYAFVENNKIVGAFVLNNDPQGDYDVGNWAKPLDCSQYSVIHSLATLPEAFGRGIGTKMVEYAIEQAKLSKLHAIRLDIVPTNFPAQKLYTKMGFRFVGEYDLKRGYDDIPTFCLYELLI